MRRRPRDKAFAAELLLGSGKTFLELSQFFGETFPFGDDVDLTFIQDSDVEIGRGAHAVARGWALEKRDRL